MTERDDGRLRQESAMDGTSSPVAGPALNKLDPEIGFSRRYEIINRLSEQMADAGIETRTKYDPNISLILAMTLNALMPEYECSFRLERNTKVVLPPLPEVPYLRDVPDIQQQQEIVRYLRENKGLHDSLIECVALTLALGDPYFQPGTPAIEIDNFGELKVGSVMLGKINDTAGVVFIPGCGLSGLKMSVELMMKSSPIHGAANVEFLLCDNHPFVAEVGARLFRYMAEPRILFLPLSMGEIEIPDNTTHVLLSYVEAAGREELTNVIQTASQRNPISLIAVSGTAPNEYSGLTSNDLRRIFLDNDFSEGVHKIIPSYTTHLVRDGKSVDFCDLTVAEAHQLIMAELPGGPSPSTQTAVMEYGRKPL